MNTTTRKPVDHLSLLQRQILRRLLELQLDNPDPAGDPRCIAVKELRGSGPKTRASSATFSRAIRRLAQRGFLILCNLRHGIRSGPNTGKVTIAPTDKHTRADHLLLTKLGLETAKRLIIPSKPVPISVKPQSAAMPAQAPAQPIRPAYTPSPYENKCVMCFTPYPGRPDCGLCRRNHFKVPPPG
jgi:hypothetical protein